MTWRDKAACIGLTDLFFDDSRKHEAKAVCEPCPVTEECLDAALREGSTDDFGVWGGTTKAQRHHRRYRSVPQHGEYRTYVRGCRCDECRAAKATYERDRNRRRRALAY